jgi:hypothetical protein
MRRLPAALVALTAAATVALLASPASAAGGPRSFTTDADTARAGQQIKLWGKGCRSRGMSASTWTARRSPTTRPTAQACSSTLLTTDRIAGPAGQAVTISGTRCSTRKPEATLDGQRLKLAVNRSANATGFTATATIPASATLGTHMLAAGCEAGSAGSTVLHVAEAARPAAAKPVFGTQPPSSLALWAALFSGIALLVASVGITTRRRRQP